MGFEVCGAEPGIDVAVAYLLPQVTLDANACADSLADGEIVELLRHWQEGRRARNDIA